MNGGEDMCVFKIGITANVVTRMDDYRAENFTFLAAIHCDEDLTAVESMEIHCVRLFHHLSSCRNINGGGESMRTKEKQPRHPGPYILYCVAARADSRARIGG